MKNRMDMEKAQVLCQDIGTYPFRASYFLFCKRKKHKDTVIYSGLDIVDGRFELFYEKMCKALDLLSGNKYSDVLFSSLQPKKIIGSPSTTRVWRFPRSIEVNFERVFSVPEPYLSGEILYECLRFYYAKTCHSALARQKARVEEYSYVKNYFGAAFNDAQFSKYRSQRPMTEDQISIELKNTLSRLKMSKSEPSPLKTNSPRKVEPPRETPVE